MPSRCTRRQAPAVWRRGATPPGGQRPPLKMATAVGAAVAARGHRRRRCGTRSPSSHGRHKQGRHLGNGSWDSGRCLLPRPERRHARTVATTGPRDVSTAAVRARVRRHPAVSSRGHVRRGDGARVARRVGAHPGRHPGSALAAAAAGVAAEFADAAAERLSAAPAACTASAPPESSPPRRAGAERRRACRRRRAVAPKAAAGASAADDTGRSRTGPRSAPACRCSPTRWTSSSRRATACAHVRFGRCRARALPATATARDDRIRRALHQSRLHPRALPRLDGNVDDDAV